MGLLAADFFVVRKTPLVVAYCGAAQIEPDVERLRRRDEKPVVLEHLAWWAASHKRMSTFRERQRRLGTLGIDHHLLVNDEDEDALRRRHGVRGTLCSANLYCDEHVFDIAAPGAGTQDSVADGSAFAALGVEGRFDAVYVASLKAYKRLELARQVEKLLVLTYGGDLHKYCPALSHARFNRRWMPAWAMAASMRHSNCGLVLSAVEGQNNATVEYQLCGLPVVSTPSKGGRALFLHEGASLIVEPHAGAVAEGVAHFRAAPPDAADTRARVLARIRAHREALCRYVATILEDRRVGVDGESLIREVFVAGADRAARFVRRRDVGAWKPPASSTGGVDHPRT